MFEALKDLDEFVGIRFGYQGPGQENPEWQFIDHSGFDGVGGFAKILRERGASLKSLPKISRHSRVKLSALWESLPGLVRSRKFPSWRDTFPTSPARNNQAPGAFATHRFNHEQTQQLLELSRHHGVSVNSLLLHSLDAAIRSFLEDSATPISWMVPVNLRGMVKREVEESNHSSYLTPRICADDSLQTVHSKIRRKLQTGQHLLTWKTYSLTRFLSHSAKKMIIRHNRVMADHCLGCFSNLGEWDPGCQWTGEQLAGNWFFSPPTLRCQKIAAGCLTFQNQLTLTLQIHPELTSDPEIARKWIKAWVGTIKLDATSDLKS